MKPESAFSQDTQYAFGMRSGIASNSFLDRSLSYKTYHTVGFDPLNLRFRRETVKNSQAMELYFSSVTLLPKQDLLQTLSDEIHFQTAYLEYSYLRHIPNRDNLIRFSIGPGLSGSAFFADRYYEKSFAGSTSLRSYEITYASLQLMAQVTTTIWADMDMGLLVGAPIISLNTSTYNARVNPLDQSLKLSGLSGQSGLRIDFSLRKHFHPVLLELYYKSNYTRYDDLYEKRHLNHRSGVGIYYVF